MIIYVALPAEADPETYKSNCSCTFDGILCLWEQDTTDDFDWTRYKGATGSGNTGPGWDHTSKNGKRLVRRRKIFHTLIKLFNFFPMEYCVSPFCME